jgi:phosphoglycolate phosphatase-like HAD superfamily hydrolase
MAPNNIAIFDIDGTLALSLEADDTIIVNSLAKAFDIQSIDDNWGSYTTSTDSGIIPEILTNAFGRPSTKQEYQTWKATYVELLTQENERRSDWCKPMPGAQDLINELRANDDWCCAMATGSIGESALIKLGSTGLELERVPFSNANNGYKRTDIIKHALEQTKIQQGVDEFQRIVYVGDGLWDLRAAKSMGICHLGRQTGDYSRKLYEAGARHVVNDFTNTEMIMGLLNTAVPV